MKSTLICAAAILCIAPAAFPQAAFDVATIKSFDARNGVRNAGFTVYPGGRVVAHALPLKSLIMAAYDVGYWQLSGGEDWMENDLYEVEAKPAAGSAIFSLRHTRFGMADERLRTMLRTLLTERFQLRVRQEKKTGAVYLLEKSNRPLLLVATKYTEENPVTGTPGFSGEIEHVGGHWFLFNTSLPQLAKFASNNILRKTVIDRTGVDGLFDYRDADTKTDLGNDDTEVSFQTWLRDVGLKITASTGIMETLVIEHAEKPSAN